jgi:LuxR family maltose regulon positive regulatory protein
VLGGLGDRDRSAELIAEARSILRSCPDAGTLPQRLSAAERALRADQEPGRQVLTERELRILKLLDSDLSERDVGSELYVSYNTVHSHVRSIYRKLGISSRRHAIQRGRELDLF